MEPTASLPPSTETETETETETIGVRVPVLTGRVRAPGRRTLTRRLRGLISLIIFPPAGLAVVSQLRSAARHEREGDEQATRVARMKARHWTSVAVVGAVSVVVLGLTAAMLLSNRHALLRDFFDVQQIFQTLPLILEGFWLNVKIFMVAEVVTLVWALVVAVIRGLPGRLALPVRGLATVYVDFFRGMPSLLVILIVVYGLRRTGLPVVSQLDDFWSVVLAITLTYGAYTAEVIKGAIDGVHPSQVSAARSLGLSYSQTMRFVIIPPALRSIVPPLLNGFIGLQKETSLVSIIGMLDAVNFAQSQSIQNANLSALTGVSLCFVVITIPLTRLADRLLRKDRARTQGGAPA